MTTQYKSKLITQLRHHAHQIDILGLLYLLNYFISKKTYPLQYIHNFINHNYSHESINWETMDQQTILNFYHQSHDYIEKHNKKWKQETQKQEQLQYQFIQEKKKIKKILKEKSCTKQQLIDSYIEEIRRNKTILTKSPTQKPKQQQQTYTLQQPVENDKYKYHQNIELLQQRIHIMKDPRFDQDNYQKSIEQPNRTFLQQETLLNNLINELQFKINYFQNIEKNSQLQEAFQKKKKLISKTKTLNRKLHQLFLHYSSQNFDSSLSFEKNQSKLKHIDLRLFLKYFKELKDSHPTEYFNNDQKGQKKFKTNNLTVVFKKYAQNHREINFIQFLQINYDLFFNKQNAFQNQSEPKILGDIKEKIKIELDESLNKFQEELSKFQSIKDVFYNEKVNKIINFNDKNSETASQIDVVSQIQKSPNQSSPTKKTNRQKKMGKFIDKTLEDYQKTKNKIHQTFLTRRKKQQIQSFEERIAANIQNNNSIKIIVSKDKSGFAGKFNQKLGFKKRHQSQLKFTGSPNKTDFDIHFSNKQIFDQIIREVEQENEEQENGHKLRYQKNRSTSDILSANNSKFGKGKFDGNDSAISKRRSSTGSLKNIFTLPKITRMSEEKMQSQSITKTLSYLYNKLGKQQEPKIKKMLQLDNSEAAKVNKIENQYLKEYFTQVTNIEGVKVESEQRHNHHSHHKHKKQEMAKPSCKKFKEENYQKFMKFS